MCVIRNGVLKHNRYNSIYIIISRDIKKRLVLHNKYEYNNIFTML